MKITIIQNSRTPGKTDMKILKKILGRIRRYRNAKDRADFFRKKSLVESRGKNLKLARQQK